MIQSIQSRDDMNDSISNETGYRISFEITMAIHMRIKIISLMERILWR
jgi:hypothetical protein